MNFSSQKMWQYKEICEISWDFGETFENLKFFCRKNNWISQCRKIPQIQRICKYPNVYDRISCSTNIVWPQWLWNHYLQYPNRRKVLRIFFHIFNIEGDTKVFWKIDDFKHFIEGAAHRYLMDAEFICKDMYSYGLLNPFEKSKLFTKNKNICVCFLLNEQH